VREKPKIRDNTNGTIIIISANIQLMLELIDCVITDTNVIRKTYSKIPKK